MKLSRQIGSGVAAALLEMRLTLVLETENVPVLPSLVQTSPAKEAFSLGSPLAFDPAFQAPDSVGQLGGVGK